MNAHSIDEQIAEVRRELRMRRHVYPRFVEDRRITQAQADERIALLVSVLETLNRVRNADNPPLFESDTPAEG
jgi:hypothetical protein